MKNGRFYRVIVKDSVNKKNDVRYSSAKPNLEAVRDFKRIINKNYKDYNKTIKGAIDEGIRSYIDDCKEDLSLNKTFERDDNISNATVQVQDEVFISINDRLKKLWVEIVQAFDEAEENAEEDGTSYRRTVQGIFDSFPKEFGKILGRKNLQKKNLKNIIIEIEKKNIEKKYVETENVKLKEAYEKLLEYLRVKESQSDLLFNEIPKSKEVEEMIQEKIEENPKLRFEKARTWIKNNLPGVSVSVVLGVTGISLTVYGILRSATKSISAQTGKGMKAIGDELKELGNQLGKIGGIVLGTLGAFFYAGSKVFDLIEKKSFCIFNNCNNCFVYSL